MDNIMSREDMPLGLGMALSKNVEAMNYFSGLSNAKQNSIIEHTHSIRSKQEMQQYVNSLTQNIE